MIKSIALRISTDCRSVIYELKVMIKTLFSLSKAALMRRKIGGANIEIGSLLHREGFYTLDIDWRADFPFDLRIGLPFRDDSIAFIYAEHVLEHFSYNEYNHILREVFRVLIPGGIFSVVVPDIRPVLTAYTVPDNIFTNAVSYEYPQSFEARLDIINYLLYMDGAHKYSFDAENMAWALRRAGFSDVRTREFDSDLDKPGRKQNSLYLECIKPRQA